MDESPPKIVPLGESAAVIEFGREITVQLNERSIALSALLEREPFPGFIEAIPAYASVTVFFDLPSIAARFPRSRSVFEAVRAELLSKIETAPVKLESPSTVIEIPTEFSARTGLDLEHIAVERSLSVTEIIEIFTARTYRVFMIGFLPGFAYMGEVDGRIRMPRKHQPRLRVPKGSVGIAGAQTGIYPLESPGGWQIVGRTDIELFQPDDRQPSLLKAGDLVRFVPTT